MINEYRTLSPPNQRHHHRSMCLPVCFSSSTHPFDVLDDEDHVRTPRSPMMPELRDRCRNLISKIGVHRRRRAVSADFSYDAYSYALNFEDENARAADDFILRRHLPPSASGSLTPPEKSTTSRNILDESIMEEDEDREEWKWRKSAPENVQKSQINVSRVGHRGRNRHSSTSADFSYEPSSYALNFEDDSSKADELGPLHEFMARLPHSPTCNGTTTPPTAKCSIAAFS